MKKIRKISADVLAVFVNMAEGLDEVRLELEDQPTLLIRWGQWVQMTDGVGQLIALGILPGATADEFSYRMEFIVYENSLTGSLNAYAISRRIDPSGKNETACIMTNNQVTTVFRYEQEALSNHADRWLAELTKLGYPEISIR